MMCHKPAPGNTTCRTFMLHFSLNKPSLDVYQCNQRASAFKLLEKRRLASLQIHLFSRQRLEFRTSTWEIKQQKVFFLKLFNFFLKILNKGKIILQNTIAVSLKLVKIF